MTSAADHDFRDVDHPKGVPHRSRLRIARFVLIPLLVLSGLHMLGTGSPIPLWHIENLHDPVAVVSIGDEALVLADGRRVRLPFIKKLPKDDPVFVRVLRHGVEVGDEGRVVGLIEPRRMCGNDPVVYSRNRIDLSELAGLLDPDGIDDSLVPPALIQDFKETGSWGRDSHGMPFDVMSGARQVRRIFEAAREAPGRRDP